MVTFRSASDTDIADDQAKTAFYSPNAQPVTVITRVADMGMSFARGSVDGQGVTFCDSYEIENRKTADGGGAYPVLVHLFRVQTDNDESNRTLSYSYDEESPHMETFGPYIDLRSNNIRTVDVNGDGLDDIVIARDFPSTGMRVYFTLLQQKKF